MRLKKKKNAHHRARARKRSTRSIDFKCVLLARLPLVQGFSRIRSIVTGTIVIMIHERTRTRLGFGEIKLAIIERALGFALARLRYLIKQPERALLLATAAPARAIRGGHARTLTRMASPPVRMRLVLMNSSVARSRVARCESGRPSCGAWFKWARDRWQLVWTARARSS